MNGSASDPLAWSRGRIWGAFVMMTAAQVGLIFWLSERKPIVPRRSDSTTTFYLVADAPPGSPVAELLDIEDPTLFALPDPRVFSGRAWMTAPPVRHQSQDWTEPIRWLTLPVAELGAAFAEFGRTNLVGHRLLADKPAPQVSEVTVSLVPIRQKSTFRIEGELAGRELLAPPEVPSIPHTNILTNTVVQVYADQRGFVFSPIPLSSSGSRDADQRALDLAKSLRFKPAARNGSALARDPTALMWGKVIFQWHTLEMTATNSPAGRSPP